ncbi:hypothetical protein [Pseudomonas sp. PDM27]|uniref:serine/threonine protein kinase n=1 Tax=Pseudomonas sp. PDM27 TaxID=2854769 RepID=UPI001C48CD54|nr:hypothetical protein [Pseudomonas sp. PDM27]
MADGKIRPTNKAMTDKNMDRDTADGASNGVLVDWEHTQGQKTASGGQGKVAQVRHRYDGRIGALKTLHPEHLNSKERRYRMQQEVHLLNLLDASGVPRVLLNNVDEWRSVGKPLYAIVEWVEGPTLADFCSGQPQNIDTALRVMNGLINIVGQCHIAGVLHRDIKPDNIILCNGNASVPVLIDFGMGWAAPDENKFGDLLTGPGQELGNRFLRLPEYAPSHHVRDTRSDVTMLVAILFYVLTGAAPRVLVDPTGKMPHEAMLARFSESTTTDPRWERLRRIFKVGFQQRIDMRFQDTHELANALASVSASTDITMTNPIDQHLQRIRELTESSDGALLEQSQRDCLRALGGFFNNFMARIQEFGFEAGGQGPVVAEWSRAVRTTLFLSKIGSAEPRVGFVHQISFENGHFEASYCVVGEAMWTNHYVGPLADADTLQEVVTSSVDRILGVLLERYATVLETHLARMRQ